MSNGKWRGVVKHHLEQAGFLVDAEAFGRCSADKARVYTSNKIEKDSRVTGVFTCADGCEALVCRETCHLRICPDCCRRAGARLVARYLPVMQKQRHPGYRYRKIVLTTPVDLRQSDVRTEIKRLRKCVTKLFDKMLPSGWRKTCGFVVGDEFGPTGNKLHFHVLIYSPFIDNRRESGKPLEKAWSEVTGGQCRVVFIQVIPKFKLDTELQETLKYVVKFSKSINGETVMIEPSLVAILHAALKRTRRVRSYGIFYNISVEDDDPPVPVCRVCGLDLVRTCVRDWNAYLTKKGLQFRIGNKSVPIERGNIGKDVLLPGMPVVNKSYYDREFEGM